MIFIYAAIYFVFGAIFGTALLTLIGYAWNLRRQLKDAQAIIEDIKHPDGALHVDTRTGQFYPPEPTRKASQAPRDEPRFSGIGPTDIYSRELYERQQAERESTPPFASPKTLNPDLKDIREAAHEATAGNRVN